VESAGAFEKRSFAAPLSAALTLRVRFSPTAVGFGDGI
jgi:hypothetical protein